MQNLKMKRIITNKKGFAIELLALLVIGIICLLFFAGWKYGINLINSNLPSENITIGDNAPINLTEATTSLNYYNTGLDELGTIGFLIIFGFSIATLITGYYARNKPILIFVYFLVLILILILSYYISNAYETLLSDEVLGSTLSSYDIADWVMLHLPLWIGVIGFIGIILMFAGVLLYRGEQ